MKIIKKVYTKNNKKKFKMKKYKKKKRQIRRYLSKFFDYLPRKTSYKNLLHFYSFTTYINEYLNKINSSNI